MAKVQAILKAIFSVYAFLIFCTFLFLLFPFIVLASLFGKVRGGNIIYKLCTFWADCAMFFWAMPHRNYYESRHDHTYPVVFVFNHISYIDIPVLLKAFRKQPIRVLGKAEMAKVPIFGFVYRNAAILVHRSSSAARAKSVAELKAFIHQKISVVIAPEGTFNTTGKPLKDFYDGAFRIAIETQTPIKPVIFLDTYDRLHYKNVFSMCPGRSRAVFLEEVGVEGLVMDDINFLKTRVYASMEEALTRYNVSWIGHEQ